MRQLSPSLFHGRHFDHTVIILCVRWYITYKLSYRDLVEMMAERGVRDDDAAAALRGRLFDRGQDCRPRVGCPPIPRAEISDTVVAGRNLRQPDGTHDFLSAGPVVGRLREGRKSAAQNEREGEKTYD